MSYGGQVNKWLVSGYFFAISNNMKTLGVIANCGKTRASVVLSLLEKEAEETNLKLLADKPTGDLLKSVRITDDKTLFTQSDIIMVLGGDGTLIKAARKMGNIKKPIIGVNIGSLGFLTSIAEDELHSAIKYLLTDNYHISKRTTIDGRIIRNGEIIAEYNALNDIVITRESSTRLIVLDVTIDESEVTSYRCDGLIVSTPTGSTGHSLSAGGPILMPETRVFVMSLICPHTLSSRPLVISDNSRITIDTANNNDQLIITADGQVGEPLQCGDKIEISKSTDKEVQLINLPNNSYFSVLRHKLGWRGSSI